MSDEQTQPQDASAEEKAPETTETTQEESAASEEASQEEVKTEEAPKEEEKPNPSLAYKEKLVEMDDLKAGQTVRLHERIKDISPKGEERERIQVFEGIILAMGGSGISRTITLRKVSNGVGVEKIYPINSPLVAKIELIKTARVRQAKLGFLKNPKRRFKRKLQEVYTELGKQKKKKKK